MKPRDKMIVTAALLMREKGVEATSFSDVIERSGAPRGSIYHHFPGGKAELIEAATRYAGDFTAAGLARSLAGDDPVAAVRMFVSAWTELLQDSDFGEGCPVVAATLEGGPGARARAAAAFEDWQELIAASIRPRVGPRRAASIAALVIASIEGAVVLARAQRTVRPVEQVARELEDVIAAALAAGRGRATGGASAEASDPPLEA
jgi:AcrR family transcriptional regulator